MTEWWEEEVPQYPFRKPVEFQALVSDRLSEFKSDLELFHEDCFGDVTPLSIEEFVQRLRTG